MNETRSVVPSLNSLYSSGLSGVLNADGLSGDTSSTSAVFAQLLQSAMQQDGVAAGETGSYDLATLLASLMQGEDGSEGSLLLLAALSARKNPQATFNTTQTVGSAQAARAYGSAQALSAHNYTMPVVSVNGRNAGTYRTVIDRFNVESNRRYAVNQQGKGDTYCNLFVTDVTRAMKAEIPHFVDKTTGRPLQGAGGNAMALSANGMNDWLNRYGEKYGWRKASPEDAQAYANAGMPAVTSWKNPGGHGHIQVVSPSADGTFNEKRGVAIAQAGRKLINYGYIDQVFGAGGRKNVEYYVHS